MFDEADFEKRLLAVEWSAYEKPLDGSIPHAILGLMRSRPEEWPQWQASLEACLLPQASFSDGILHAIPFLMELVREGRGQPPIYWLFSIVLDCTEEAEGDAWLSECRALVKEGLSVYLRDLADSGLPASVRCSAVLVISSLPELRGIWESTVLAVLEAERSTEVGKEIRRWFHYD